MPELGKVAAVRMKHILCGTITGWHPSVLASIEDGRLGGGYCCRCSTFPPFAQFERADPTPKETP